MRPFVVNGRFLRGRPTGMQRVARSLLTAAASAGHRWPVLAPAGVRDPLATRWTPAPPGRVGDVVWEQTVLPVAAGRRGVVSLVNTAPVLAPHGVVMVHDLAFVVGPQWFARSVRVYRAVVLTAARRAEAVLTVSGQVATELAHVGVRPDRISVVRPAVDAQLRPAAADAVEAVRRRYRLSRPYLLFVGWADPRKDLATALAAHEQVRSTVPHDLVLIGRPHPMFAPVRVPRSDSVHPLGFVSEDELAALLTGAAALVYPSRYEGFGLPPLEAWRCGTPALVSELPALRESTEGRAVYLPVGDVASWADAVEAALRGSVPAPAPSAWTWADAAGQLVAALPR